MGPANTPCERIRSSGPAVRSSGFGVGRAAPYQNRFERPRDEMLIAMRVVVDQTPIWTLIALIESLVTTTVVLLKLHELGSSCHSPVKDGEYWGY